MFTPCTLGMLLVILWNVVSENGPPIRPKSVSTLCAEHLAPIAWPSGAWLDRSPHYVNVFPTLIRALKSRNYSEAAEIERRFDHYNDGLSPTYYGRTDAYAFRGRYREYYLSSYQNGYCYANSTLPFGAVQSGVAVLYAQALEAAIDGNFALAHKIAIHAYGYDKQFQEALLLAGFLSLEIGSREQSHAEWLKVLTSQGYADPPGSADNGPIGAPVAAIQYLLHFRP